MSLVAEDENGKIIGQIVLYKTIVTTAEQARTELVLSPLCVHPDYFRRGIARALVESAFAIARNMGYRAVFLCGAPELYRKFGFLPTYNYNIFHITDAERNAEWCMAHELMDGTLADISGTIDIV